MKIHEFGNTSAKTVLIQPIDEHSLDSIENEIDIIRKNSSEDFMLTCFIVDDWNKDLSPWKAPAVFGNEDFGNGAEALLVEILKYCADKEKTYYIGGYSLAGLFALWATYKTDIFKGAAAVSPSMWFPGFDEFMKEHEIKCSNIYLSLGNKEEKARNPVMATVGDKIRAAHDLLQKKEINCILEWNEGNHFRDPDLRTAKGFSWILKQI